MQMNAKISGDGVYRYWLSRRWDPRSMLAWVMLNPSTADAELNDPTIRQVIHFSAREGYGGCIVMNLFALRSPDSSLLRRHRAPVGPYNDRYLERLAEGWQPIVCAWGSKALPARVHEVLEGPLKDSELLCLGKTTQGYPRHPLYLPHDREFESFR